MAKPLVGGIKRAIGGDVFEKFHEVGDYRECLIRLVVAPRNDHKVDVRLRVRSMTVRNRFYWVIRAP